MQNPSDQSQNALIGQNQQPQQAQAPVQDQDDDSNARLIGTTGGYLSKPGYVSEISAFPPQPETPKPQEYTPPQEKQAVTEIFKSPETLPTQPQQPMPTAKEIAQQITATENTQPLNVVDQTKEDSTLHPISKSVDKLTTIADLEEEKFIKEVEAAHEHQ